jgi:hypothetical protein
MVSMTHELTDHGVCQGCGGDAAVLYEEVALCGSCFYIASLTAVRRASRLLANSATDRVAETATMIASLVDSMRSRGDNGR